MPEQFKPANYNSVSPYIVARHVPPIIDFLKHAFGADELYSHRSADGSIMHAEVRIDDSVLMIGGVGDEGEPTLSNIHVYVADVDSTYQKALTAGGTSIQAPVQKNDPDKRAGVRGPGGNNWWIATMVGESPR